MRTLDYRTLALELMEASRPKEKRRPPSELEQYEHVKDGTLRYLLEHEGTAAPAQLIDFFEFSHARLTKILGDLEAVGYVRRESDPADRRRVIVHLTDSGRAYAEAKHEEMVTRFSVLLEALGEEDALAVIRISHKLRNMFADCGLCEKGNEA